MDFPADNRLAATLTADEKIDLLEALVQIPSPSGDERAASIALVAWMQGQGFAARVDEAGNAMGSRGEGPREILLLGHIDTFPGLLPVERVEGWLSGRGTVDAKGPLCAFAAAAASIQVPSGWRVTVVGAVEEEAATSKGARYLLSEHSTPDYCVIGEPSAWDRITLGYKGRLLAHLRLRAPFAHSAGEAALPAERAVGLWQAIVAHCETFNAERTGVFSRLEPSLRSFNTLDDGAYGVVEMTVGFRLPLGQTPDALADQLNALLLVDAPATLAVSFTGGEAAYQADKNTPLVRGFLHGIRQRDAHPRFVVKTGTSDMNVVGPVWDRPILAYGPGNSSLDHTPDERIELAEYLKAIDVLTAALTHLMTEETNRL